MRHKVAAAFVVLIATAIGVGLWMQRSHNPGGPLETGNSHGPPIEFAATADSRLFSLVDQYGRAVTNESFRGEWLIVFFGFTHCPAVCPTTLSKVAAALDELGTRGEHVRVALITVDPARDEPEVLAKYLEPFGPRFVGLTGTANQLAAATRIFGAYSQLQTASVDGTYDVQHSAHLDLLGPDGRFRRQISSDATSGQLAATLSKSLASS
jgi:protein SCO1/2